MSLKNLKPSRFLLQCNSRILKHIFENNQCSVWSPVPRLLPSLSLMYHRKYSNAPSSFHVDPGCNHAKGSSSMSLSKLQKKKMTFSSVVNSEVAKFTALSETWWDFSGPFRALHAMNPARVSFIRSTLCRQFGRDPQCARPLEGLRILDVGCGGGILSEPLARLGALVTGIDAVEKNIEIAKFHSEQDFSTLSIEYSCSTAERLVEDQKKFDAVIALEVVEHVADPLEFCQSFAALSIVNGAVIISTINRSLRAYAGAVFAAEYLFHFLPKGTHDWSNFLIPEELVLLLQRASVLVHEMAGLSYNPLSGEWSLSDDLSINYILCGKKGI